MTNESTRPEPAQSGPTHGFNRMTPYFPVADPEALIAFMIAVFDAEILKKWCPGDPTFPMPCVNSSHP